MADGDGKTEAQELKERLDNFEQQMKPVLEGFQNLSGNINQLVNKVQELEQNQQKGGSQDGTPADADPPTSADPDEIFQGQDLDTLPTDKLVKGIFQAVTKQMDSKISEHLKPVNERLESHVTRSERERVKEEYDKLKDRDPSVDKWLDEIRELHKKYPNASMTHLYAIAKEENPDKAEQLHKEAAGDDEKNKDEESKPRNADDAFSDLLFGGMSGSQGGTPKKDRTDKSIDEAAEDAFSEVFSQFGAQAEA